MSDYRYQPTRRYLTKNGKKPIGTVWIVLTIIFFWPLGLTLLVLRLKNRPGAVRQNGNILLGTGIFFLLIALCYIIGLSESAAPSQSILVSIIVGTLGVVLLLLGLRGRKTGGRYERYLSLIGRQRVVSIDDLASLMTASYDQAVVDLQHMVYEGYFQDAAEIDFSGHRLLIGCDNAPTSHSSMGPLPHVPTQPPVQGPRTVTCKGCGAINTIPPGGNAVCEYCDSPLV